MSDVLLINVTGQETRVALVEDGVLAEFYVEHLSDRGIVGNIYHGKVVRILPGMQAAFVDIGTERSAFLYVSEVLNEHFSFSLVDPEDEPLEEHVVDGTTVAIPPKRKARATCRIEDLLKEGQEILVQTAKDPIGTKGARLTCHITLPGRFLVFMPTVNHIGISRRIASEAERRRLRELIDEIRPEGSGFIVRTAAATQPSEHLRRDMHVLVESWHEVLSKRDKLKAPALLHADFDLVLRATRDLGSTKIDRIIVDSPALYERIPEFIRRFMPGFYCNVELYQQTAPMFDAFGIEMELDRALKRKVWLRSGGYLVIDQTEALTAVDVNTGRYVGKTSLEETITKINLEAVHEIVYQLRLRNIGGLIIIDFIDMDQRENRERVYQELAEALEKDKARTNLLKISDFGLVEMTRKRVQENLAQQLCEPCPYCEGLGRVKSSATVAYETLRGMKRAAVHAKNGALEVHAHSSVVDYLRKHETESISALESSSKAQPKLCPSESLHRETFRTDVALGKKPSKSRAKSKKKTPTEDQSDKSDNKPAPKTKTGDNNSNGEEAPQKEVGLSN